MLHRHVSAPAQGRAALRGSAPRRLYCLVARSLGTAVPLLINADLNPQLRASTKGPGVYAVYDAASLLQYIGVSRDVFTSVTSHAAALPDAAHTARVKLLPGANRAALQASWKAWVVEHGSVPPGNAAGGDARWTATAASSARARPAVVPAVAGAVAAEAVAPSLNPLEWACAAAEAAVTAEVFRRLVADGYVICDGAFSEEIATQARAAADALLAAGRLRDIPSQVPLGRTDESLVMDLARDGTLLYGGASRGAAAPQGSAAAGLAHIAGLLKGIPAALLRHQGQEGAMAAGAWPPAFAPPQSLQLAVYPGAGTRYARHLDNDPAAPGVSDGPAGQRVSDRSVTCIVYLNPGGWAPEDGGHLRLYLPNGRTEDVAPLAGRLVLFQSCMVEHEVLPAFRRRWALSAWVPRRDAFDT